MKFNMFYTTNKIKKILNAKLCLLFYRLIISNILMLFHQTIDNIFYCDTFSFSGIIAYHTVA